MGKREISQNIATMRKSRGYTQSDLAKLLDVSTSAVGMWESGKREPDLDTIEAMADIFNVSMASLIGNKDESTEAVPIPSHPDILPIETRKIPLLGDIACGQPTEPSDTFEAYVEAGSEVKADFALRAHGESMTGARILDGDVVFIRSQPAVDDGEIAAVMIDGETTLKRVRHAGDDLVLWPENPSYQPIIISSDSESDVRVIGKAVAFQSDVK